MNAYSCILFDLDHTLIDTDPVRIAALRELGINVRYSELSSKRFTSPYMLAREYGIASSDYQSAYLKHAAVGQCPASIHEVLSEGTRRKVKSGVVTSSPEAVARRVLNAQRLIHFFPVIIGYSRVLPNKPDGSPIIRAMERLSAKPRSTIYIGDSLKDLETSKNAGVAFGLASWGLLPGQEDEQTLRSRSDVVLTSMSDVLQI
jgi:HAD superfamily hydrolase (TIGR01549 family)